jgi:hypothetical protein
MELQTGFHKIESCAKSAANMIILFGSNTKAITGLKRTKTL